MMEFSISSRMCLTAIEMIELLKRCRGRKSVDFIEKGTLKEAPMLCRV
jgi:hypothetical protein